MAVAGALSVLTACYERTPLNVTVLDAETREPVAGAWLHVAQGEFMEFFAPSPVYGFTGDDGRATLEVVVRRRIRLTAMRSGHCAVFSMWDPVVGSINVSDEWSDGGVTLYAIREPYPRLQCELPQDFRGTFRIVLDAERGEKMRRDSDNVVRLRNFEDGIFYIAPGFPYFPTYFTAASYPDGAILQPKNERADSESRDHLWVWPKLAYDSLIRPGVIQSFSPADYGVFVVASLNDIEKAKPAGAYPTEGTTQPSE